MRNFLRPAPARRTAAVVLLTISLSLALASCGSSDERTTWEKAGKAADADEIESYRGDGHCDWEDVTFLRVGWPLGTASQNERARMYVRDPKRLLVDESRAAYQSHASLPAAAADTGYSSEIGELWLVSEDQAPDVAYIVTGEGRVEAWPQTKMLLGCD